MSAPDATPARGDVNRIARRMIATWNRVDPSSDVARYPASFIANFADMARDLLIEYAIIPKAELAALTAERDALAQRVAALEAFVRKAEKDWSCDEDDHWMADACDKCRALDALRATPTPEAT